MDVQRLEVDVVLPHPRQPGTYGTLQLKYKFSSQIGDQFRTYTLVISL